MRRNQGVVAEGHGEDLVGAPISGTAHHGRRRLVRNAPRGGSHHAPDQKADDEKQANDEGGGRHDPQRRGRGRFGLRRRRRWGRGDRARGSRASTATDPAATSTSRITSSWPSEESRTRCRPAARAWRLRRPDSGSVRPTGVSSRKTRAPGGSEVISSVGRASRRRGGVGAGSGVGSPRRSLSGWLEAGSAAAAAPLAAGRPPWRGFRCVGWGLRWSGAGNGDRGRRGLGRGFARGSRLGRDARGLPANRGKVLSTRRDGPCGRLTFRSEPPSPC